MKKTDYCKHCFRFISDFLVEHTVLLVGGSENKSVTLHIKNTNLLSGETHAGNEPSVFQLRDKESTQ